MLTFQSLDVDSSVLNVSSHISVIIPCYNSERFLAEAIESVLAQTHPAAEIIVVDDGSTDHTRQVAARYPQVTYLYQHNQGTAVARNTGIQASKGDYFVFLDSDDRLLPNALETGIQSLKLNPDCGFAFGWCNPVDRDGLPLQAQTAFNRQIARTPAYETLLSGMCLHPPARFMFERAVLDTIGGFDPVLKSADDYDFYLRAAAAFPGCCHNQSVVEYRQHGASISNVTRSAMHFSEALAIFRKQRSFVQAYPVYQALHQHGLRHWIGIYGPYMVYDTVFWLKQRQPLRAAKALYFALRYYPQGMISYGKALFGKLRRGSTRSESTKQKQI